MADMVTIPRSEYEQLKRAAAKNKTFLEELDEALESCLNEPLREVHKR